MDETKRAMCEVGSAIGAEEFIVLGARGADGPTSERFADRNGNVLLPVEERAKVCADCARGEDVLLLDGCGVMVGFYYAGPGEWSHAYDTSFWPCPGVKPSGER